MGSEAGHDVVGMMWWKASGNCLCAVSLMPSPLPPWCSSPSPELLNRLVEAEDVANEALRVPPTAGPHPISLFEVKEALQVRLLTYMWLGNVYMCIDRHNIISPFTVCSTTVM